MTIEECNSAAYRRAPVVYDGITYARIERICRVFTPDNLIQRGWAKTYYTVRLEDKSGRSFTYADPAKVELAEHALFKDVY